MIKEIREKNRLLTKIELCEYLNVSLGMIDNLMKNGKIKYIKIGKSVRFENEEIDRLLKIQSRGGLKLINRDILNRIV
tara:strand:- start:2787 stop:3020 length:234 start_codon:yes stop_codon:yes gene_type:complete